MSGIAKSLCMAVIAIARTRQRQLARLPWSRSLTVVAVCDLQQPPHQWSQSLLYQHVDASAKDRLQVAARGQQFVSAA